MRFKVLDLGFGGLGFRGIFGCEFKRIQGDRNPDSEDRMEPAIRMGLVTLGICQDDGSRQRCPESGSEC